MIETGIALRTTVRDNNETFQITITKFPFITSCYVQDDWGNVLDLVPDCCSQKALELIDLVDDMSIVDVINAMSKTSINNVS